MFRNTIPYIITVIGVAGILDFTDRKINNDRKILFDKIDKNTNDRKKLFKRI